MADDKSGPAEGISGVVAGVKGKAKEAVGAFAGQESRVCASSRQLRGPRGHLTRLGELDRSASATQITDVGPLGGDSNRLRSLIRTG